MQKQISQINQLLIEGTLGQALQKIKEMLKKEQLTQFKEPFLKINTDYQLMLHYMSQGFEDQKREKLYHTLIRKTDALLADIHLHLQQSLPQLKIDANGESQWGEVGGGSQNIKQKLETFNTDVALAKEGYATQQIDEIYKEYTTYTDQLFQQIYQSPQWTQDIADTYKEIILSPTIHTNDAQLIVSAITLAINNIFDIRKFILLTQIYQQTNDQQIKQKALVGWAINIHDKIQIYPEIQQTIQQLLKSPKTQEEILQLQMQLYLCMNTEKDQQEIQQNIIPNIINNQKLTSWGEVGEDSQEDYIQNILNPEAEEQAIEETEQNIQKILEMQQKGTDIYFSSFIHMKNFSFFQNITNWFRVFDINHPELNKIKNKQNSQLLNIIQQQKLLCDNDQYSFTLAFANIMEKIPQDILQAINESQINANEELEIDANGETQSLPQWGEVGGGFPLGEVGGDSHNIPTPTLYRRLYLQTLYRFFKLYQNKNNFYNPFQPIQQQHTIYHYPQLAQYTSKTILQIIRFIYKQKNYQDLQYLLDNILTYNHNQQLEIDANGETTFAGRREKQSQSQSLPQWGEVGGGSQSQIDTNGEIQIIRAYLYIHNQQYTQAIQILKNNPKTIKLLAKAYMLNQQYEQAEQIYKQLITQQETTFADRSQKQLEIDANEQSLPQWGEVGGGSPTLVLHYAHCLIMQKKYKQATQILYKYDYQTPNNTPIMQLLAWTLLNDKKQQQALTIYQKLIQQQNVAAETILNAAYAHWITKHIEDAQTLFRQYLKTLKIKNQYQTIQQTFNNDKELLDNYQIPETERKIMADLICLNIDEHPA